MKKAGVIMFALAGKTPTSSLESRLIRRKLCFSENLIFYSYEICTFRRLSYCNSCSCAVLGVCYLAIWKHWRSRKSPAARVVGSPQVLCAITMMIREKSCV